jgi:hypothetical protein
MMHLPCEVVDEHTEEGEHSKSSADRLSYIIEGNLSVKTSSEEVMRGVHSDAGDRSENDRVSRIVSYPW